MQSRKELAEAGRRKLEEFRKSKAQGKAVTLAASSKLDAAAPPPTSSGAVSPLTNGNGVGHLTSPPAGAPVAGPRPSIWASGPDAASSGPSHGVPNGLPFGAASRATRPLEQVSPGPEPTPLPPPASNGTPAAPASPPVTSFVVLQDAPIPFGGPLAASAGPGPIRTSTSGFTQTDMNGSAPAPWSASGGPPPEAAVPRPPFGGAGPESSGSYRLGVFAPPPVSDAPLTGGNDSASAWPWDSPVAGASQGHLGAASSPLDHTGASGIPGADTALGWAMGGASGSNGNTEPSGQPQRGDLPPTVLGPWSGANAGTAAVLPTSEQPGAGRIADQSSGSNNATVPPPPPPMLGTVLPGAPDAGLGSDRAGHSKGHDVLAASGGLNWGPSGGHPAPEPQVASEPSSGPAMPSPGRAVALAPGREAAGAAAAAWAHGASAASASEMESSIAASSKPGLWSLFGGEANPGFPPASAPATSAPEPKGVGLGRASEVTYEPDSRPPWVAFSAQVPSTAVSAESTAAASAAGAAPEPSRSAWAADPAGGAVFPGDTSSATSESQQPSTSAPSSSSALTAGQKTHGPASAQAADGDAAVATSTGSAPDPSSIICYDQLSDMYLSASGAATTTGSGPDLVDSARDSTRTSQQPDSTPATSSLPSVEPGDGDAASGGSALPPLPVSVPVSAPFFPSFEGGGGSSAISRPAAPAPAPVSAAAAPPPAEQPPPWSSAAAAASVIPVPPPARTAPTTSRFAWLFGSPPSAKEPVQEVMQQSGAAQTQPWQPLQPQPPSPQPQLPALASQAPQPTHGSVQAWGVPPSYPAPLVQHVSVDSFAFQPSVAMPSESPRGPASRSAPDAPFTMGSPWSGAAGPSESVSHAASHSSLSSSAAAFGRPSSPLPGSEDTYPSRGVPLAAAPPGTGAMGGPRDDFRPGFGNLAWPACDTAVGADVSGLTSSISLMPAAPVEGHLGNTAGSGAHGSVPGSPSAATSSPWGGLDVTSARPGSFSQSASAYGSAVSYGGTFEAASSAGKDAGGAPLPSFLRAVDGGARSVQDGSLDAPTSSSLSASAAAAAGPTFQSVPSFGTSFTSPSALSAGATGLPPLAQSAPLPAGPSADPAPPPPPPSSIANPNAAMPHFNTAASYLTAYSSTSTAGASAPPFGSSATAAAPATTTTTTSSFLDAYLDNLLSTMSTTHGAPAQSHGAVGALPHRGPSPAGGNASRSDTPRHSNMGDQPPVGEASAPHAHAQARGAQPAGPWATAEGASGDLGDRNPSNSDLAAGKGSGTEAAAASHADGSGHNRSHHSRRVSLDSAGLLSHSALMGNNHTAGGVGGGSGVSRAQFAALQQHIDELTEEKLVLTRGLQQQTRINEQLAEENEELMRQYNARGAAVEELQRKVKQYEQELEAQALSLEGFSDERQAARSSYAEASSRAQALASEVVGLEAQVLQLKSSVLKAERTAEEAQQRARKLEKQVETLTKEAHERAQELQQTQLKGRNLVVRLKQTEAKLQAAEEKLAMQAALAGTHGALLPNGYSVPAPAAPPPPPPPPPPTIEQEVQCDLAAEQEAEAEAARSAAAAAAAEAQAEAEAAQGDGGAAADGASVSSGAVLDGQQLALVRNSSLPSEVPDTPERLIRVDWEAARPTRDAPSAVVAERALAELDSRALRAAARDGALPEGLDVVALQLARWLPAGPVSGGDPVAVMVEEELRLMQSIHELLGGFEAAQEAAAERVAELQARVESLTHDNEELRHKLELQTQRLELEMQGMHSGQAVSLHQTPALSGNAVEGANPSASVTSVSGAYNYQATQPFPAAPAEPDVVTPTRSTRVATAALSSLESPADVTGQTSKHTWMGYLFRPRQKKRTRSAIL